MGWFRKWQTVAAERAAEREAIANGPVQRGACICLEHTADVVARVGTYPNYPELVEEGEPPIPADEIVPFVHVYWEPEILDSGTPQVRLYVWEAFLDDEVRHLYYDLPDDGGRSGLEVRLLTHPHIEFVAHIDTEVVALHAPGMCEDGVRAVILDALADPITT